MITDTNRPEKVHTPMMKRCVGTRALWTFLWTAFPLVLFAAAEGVEGVSGVLRRHKRAWLWNMLIVHEEIPPRFPPAVIGKLMNSNFNESQDMNVEFRLSGEGAGDIFAVNEFGDVLVLKQLDREKISSYKLTAQIFNKQSGMELEEKSEFTIKVQDINDNTPEFTEPYTGSVEERARAGTVVMTVRATDKDDPSSPNGMVAYTLLNATNVFSINDRTGDISTRVSTLDRETQSVYKVLVQASDTPGLPKGFKANMVVTININDINDNQATFSKKRYHVDVKEDEPVGFKIAKLDIQDRDEKQNKKPVFTVEHSYEDMFDLELNDNNDAVLILKKELDYETRTSYTFTINLKEHVVQPPDNGDAWTSAQIYISVQDVDEPPVFSQKEYTFKVLEGQKNIIVGSVSAKDTDKSSHRIRYSIKDPSSPVSINSETGQLTLRTALDRELQEEYKFHVTAKEESSMDLSSWAMVKIKVLDINDNEPELTGGSDVYICENDESGTVIGVISASDKDENLGKFHFILTTKSSNFSLHDNQNSTASIILTHGGFSTKSSVENILEVEITDGGSPPKKSVSLLHLPVCVCGSERRRDFCKSYSRSGVSMSALIAILLCIITILVIVILFVLRKRYQKEALVALGKPSGEIHEQLVAYDEEGGGEMDTNVYDVSILTSVRSEGRLGPEPAPAMYALVKKPSACKGDMAAMIEVKKDEADHDRDGIPFDTLHIYGYEGSESLAGSLSSLQSSSSVRSDLDYDFLNDWGPRFRTLAQIYGSGENTSY